MGSYEGTVEEITMRSYNNRRIRLSVGIGYQDSIERARSVMRQLLDKTEGALNEPAPSIFVAELAPSSVNFNVFSGPIHVK